MDVLIVDDDRLTRMGLISIMPWRDFGMRVVGEASNGFEALDFMGKNHVDLVLSDIEMPGMQGLKFIEKASALYPEAYYVVLTIHTDFSRIQQAIRLGAIDYIAKTDFGRENNAIILKRIVDRIQKENSRKRESPKNEIKLPVFDDTILNEWTDLGWLWQDNQHKSLMNKLNRYQLTDAFLVRLTEKITDTWNCQYSQIASYALTAPEVSKSGFSLYEWTEQLCRQTRQLLTLYPYSEEIFISIVTVGYQIREELANPIRVSDVAQRVHLSRSYFCQCFRDIYHMSFFDYLRKLRMEKSIQLLLKTNANIQSIAKDTGYEDEKYFSRIFKSVYGISPFDYRKAHR